MITRNFLFTIIVLLTLLALPHAALAGVACNGEETATSPSFWQAYEQKATKAQVTVAGKVKKILSDDHKGNAHQRFIVDAGKVTVLVAHNIDLAPKVPLHIGDQVAIYGEYIYKEKGGVLHWTHHDPRHNHDEGWICFNGKMYQ